MTTTQRPTRYTDPTDRGQRYPDAQRAEARYPADQLSTLQMQRGICSMPGCRWPIARWCDECGVKLCYDHLQDHPCSASAGMTPYAGGQSLALTAQGQVTATREQREERGDGR